MWEDSGHIQRTGWESNGTIKVLSCFQSPDGGLSRDQRKQYPDPLKERSFWKALKEQVVCFLNRG